MIKKLVLIAAMLLLFSLTALGAEPGCGAMQDDLIQNSDKTISEYDDDVGGLIEEDDVNVPLYKVIIHDNNNDEDELVMNKSGRPMIGATVMDPYPIDDYIIPDNSNISLYFLPEEYHTDNIKIVMQASMKRTCSISGINIPPKLTGTARIDIFNRYTNNVLDNNNKKSVQQLQIYVKTGNLSSTATNKNKSSIDTELPGDNPMAPYSIQKSMDVTYRIKHNNKDYAFKKHYTFPY